MHTGFGINEYWIAFRNGQYVTHHKGLSIYGINLTFETFTTKAKLDIRLSELGVDMDEDIVNN